MIILSGIKPGGTGVGRLMSNLVQEAARRAPGEVSVISRQHWKSPREFLRKGRLLKVVGVLRDKRRWNGLVKNEKILQADPLILVQPQAAGSRWCQQLIQNRRQPTWLYVMDSSFFCLQSYNHVDGELGSCTRCLGAHWQAAREMNCRPWPFSDPHSADFLKQLHGWLGDGTVRCLVQNQRQAELIRNHCQGEPIIKVVGLWTADFDGLPTRVSGDAPQRTPYDVVFHGVPVAGKGARWTVEVAKRCPELKFLFPCKPRHGKWMGDVPANVSFEEMTWETGLADAVTTAPLVIVPSQWSATIEGALVKSISCARAVATVDEPTSFASELPAGLTLRLPLDVERAAEMLGQAVKERWEPDQNLWTNWLRDFRRSNQNLLDRLLTATSSVAREEATLSDVA